VSENSVQSCFRGKGCMARRDEGAYPPAVCDRGATKPGGLFLENPPGGGSFVRGLRWLGRYSPLRGCSVGQSGSDLAALATAKIPRRRTSRNFQTRSKGYFSAIQLFGQKTGLSRDHSEAEESEDDAGNTGNQAQENTDNDQNDPRHKSNDRSWPSPFSVPSMMQINKPFTRDVMHELAITVFEFLQHTHRDANAEPTRRPSIDSNRPMFDLMRIACQRCVLAVNPNPDRRLATCQARQTKDCKLPDPTDCLLRWKPGVPTDRVTRPGRQDVSARITASGKSPRCVRDPRRTAECRAAI